MRRRASSSLGVAAATCIGSSVCKRDLRGASVFNTVGAFESAKIREQHNGGDRKSEREKQSRIGEAQRVATSGTLLVARSRSAAAAYAAGHSCLKSNNALEAGA